jgi:small subunit ribosomal protein S16
MPTKIRLQRHGKKRNAFYHIVIADNRAPRDGKFIDKIGTYNPNTNPATIDLEFKKALDWIQTGAQPTDTVRAILSYEGVLYKNHLDRGVLKGAFSEEDADKKFDAWKKEKLGKIQVKIDSLDKAKTDQFKSRIKAEEEVSKKREVEILAKTSALAEEAKQAAAAEASAEVEAAAQATADATEEVKAEAPAKEEAPAATEEVKAEAPAKEETPAEEVKAEAPAKEETPAEEVKAEAPAKEETPSAEVKAETEAPAKEEAPAAEDKKEEDSEK